MGTWSTGPLDNDTALDFLYNLAAKPTPADREALLLMQLHLLCDFNPSHAEHHGGELEIANHIGIAACAVVAMKLAEQGGLYPYMWGCTPEADDLEDFRVEMLPEVSLPVLCAATGAISIARGLVTHPDLPEWVTNDDATAHATMLEELGDVLYAVAASTPGHPAYVRDAIPGETWGLPTHATGANVKAHTPDPKGEQPMPVPRITTRAELRTLARELGVAGDWHENDEADVTATVNGLRFEAQGITATARGVSFDNAGFWPMNQVTVTFPGVKCEPQGLPASAAVPTPPHAEMYVTLFKEGEPRGYVNLALLFSWAAEPEADTHG
jgi:hypothetical protein